VIRGAGRLNKPSTSFTCVDPASILSGLTCRWCGYAIAAGESHGIVGEATEDGQFTVRCTVRMLVRYPSKCARLDSVNDAVRDGRHLMVHDGPILPRELIALQEKRNDLHSQLLDHLWFQTRGLLDDEHYALDVARMEDEGGPPC
jgi:hypothetical protein